MAPILAACALLAFAPAAWAEGPAVSQLNSKLSVEGGAGGTSGRQSALGIAQGSATAPLGHGVGLQVDGVAATGFNAFFGGGGAHLFWRDPAIGLIGPIAAFGGGGGRQSGLYGGEAELYAGVFTVGARAGYADSRTGFGSRSGSYLGSLAVYPVPNLALSLEGGQLAGLSLGGQASNTSPSCRRSATLPSMPVASRASSGPGARPRVSGSISDPTRR